MIEGRLRPPHQPHFICQNNVIKALEPIQCKGQERERDYKRKHQVTKIY